MTMLYALSSLLGLLALSQVANAVIVPGGNCTIGGYSFFHGTNFTVPKQSPCVWYSCTDGHHSLVKGGCFFANQCIDINGVYVLNCVTYRCTEKVSGSSRSYGIGPELTECQSSDGNCYEKGSVFPYVIGGTTYDTCTCYPEGDTLKYKCSSNLPGGSGPAAPTGSCTVNGKTYANNGFFNIPGHPECLLYHCVNGQYSLAEEGCSAGGKCRAVGEDFELNCNIWRCNKETTDDKIHYQLRMITPRCTSSNGTCYEIGEFFTLNYGGKLFDKCTCSAQGTNITYYCTGSPADEGPPADCVINGQNYEHDQTFSYPGASDCIVYKCKNGRTELVDEGCEVDGICHAINSIFQRKCVTYNCTKTQTGSRISYKTHLLDYECQDAHGQCRTPGEVFPIYHENRLLEQCTCTIANRTINYSCGGGSSVTTDECEVEGVKFDDGEEFSIPNSSPCNLYLCDKGSYAPTQLACQYEHNCIPVNSTFTRKCDTAVCLLKEINGRKVLVTQTTERRCMDVDGNCLDLGSEHFPYEVDGIRHEDCSCNLLANTSIHYVCKVTGDNGGACIVHGRTFSSGEEFTLPHYPCIKYKCVDGNANHIVEEGCEVQGKCVPLGGEFVDECHTFVCEKSTENYKPIYRVKLLATRCTDAYGDCQVKGSRFDYRILDVLYPNCTCTEESNTLHYRCDVTQCVVDGYTFQHGERFSLPRQSPCVMYFCWHGGWTICKEGCEINGHCVDVDATFSSDCSTYKCVRTESEGYYYYNANLVEPHCKDADGKCHDVGSRFPYIMDEERRLSCTCGVSANSLHYTCDEEA